MCVGLSLGMSTPRMRGMCCLLLTLALLVPRVGANDEQAAVPPDQLAVLTDALHAGSYLHRPPPTPGGSAPVREETIFLARRHGGCKGEKTRKGATTPPHQATARITSLY